MPASYAAVEKKHGGGGLKSATTSERRAYTFPIVL
jgi:hypothetical protein